MADFNIASKRGAATFFATVTDPTARTDDKVSASTHGIDRMVEWANTSHSGRQFDMIDLIAQADSSQQCSSAYGLCERIT
ncbi:phosphoadenosine phosphosulfate reductase [Pseudomonas mosselii]|uniref:phosphoadenosine phosphosulfate reductase n=1 Tax=Pseudomonas mosselii TaxID=78327 RepID=UPI000D834F4E|nr:phosphoadenosine phosphosulfate reductase [Pseudomonas mosselii]PYC28946.1 phosphoadenosine phosphosulfate reductase [Pseudomonas mosselii]